MIQRFKTQTIACVCEGVEWVEWGEWVGRLEWVEWVEVVGGSRVG